MSGGGGKVTFGDVERIQRGSWIRRSADVNGPNRSRSRRSSSSATRAGDALIVSSPDSVSSIVCVGLAFSSDARVRAAFDEDENMEPRSMEVVRRSVASAPSGFIRVTR
jgi:hypothetical protein